MSVSPGSETVQVDEVFTATVRVNTAGVSIAAAEGVVKFDPAVLTVDSVSTDASIFDINAQEPEFSNSAGRITYSGVTLNPGYNGSSGTLLTVRFRARAPGSTTLVFRSGSVLANDGRGTDVLTGTSGATYSVVGTQAVPTPSVEPVPTVPAGDPLLPGVTSPTHPSSERWYSHNDPRFTWILPAGVDGVSWLISERSTANPGSSLDGLVSEVSFEDIPDGITYFHVRFQRDGQFGPVTHYQFRVDTEPPLPFTLRRVSGGDDTDPQPALTYETTDATSGIQLYRMRVGDGEWSDVPEAPIGRPYRISALSPGAYPITVEALDRAGHATRAQTVVTIIPVTVPVIEDYPRQVMSDEGFPVSGTADAGSTVLVRTTRMGLLARFHTKDDRAARASAVSDEGDRWRVDMGGLSRGTYELRATATDARGTVSQPSEVVTVRVGSSLVKQFMSHASRLLTSLPWMKILMFGVLIFLAWFIIRLARERKSHTKSDVRKDTKISSGLHDLVADIEMELATIEHLSRSRPLYPEERYLRTKLGEYRRALRKLAGKRPPRSPRPV